MKIVISAHEANQILAEHLVAQGKLKRTTTNIIWEVEEGNPLDTEIIFEQPEE